MIYDGSFPRWESVQQLSIPRAPDSLFRFWISLHSSPSKSANIPKRQRTVALELGWKVDLELNVDHSCPLRLWTEGSFLPRHRGQECNHRWYAPVSHRQRCRFHKLRNQRCLSSRAPNDTEFFFALGAIWTAAPWEVPGFSRWMLPLDYLSVLLPWSSLYSAPLSKLLFGLKKGELLLLGIWVRVVWSMTWSTSCSSCW